MTITEATSEVATVGPNRRESSILLSDEQVRSFVVDGFVVLHADVDPSVHQRIDDALIDLFAREGNPFNNLLPRIPEFRTVLESPIVRGAVQSLLGPSAILHPHRFVHTSEPLPGTPPSEMDVWGWHEMGEGSQAAGMFHQDFNSPLSRSRTHRVKELLCLYFPQDTPPEMGPTRVIAGSHRHVFAGRSERQVALFPDPAPAGTVMLCHFDLVHAGSLNVAERRRWMAKFLFCRTRQPDSPSWDHVDGRWEKPRSCLVTVDTPAAWQHQWDWLRGACRGSSVARDGCGDAVELATQVAGDDIEVATEAANALASLGAGAEPAIASLIDRFEHPDQHLRVSAIYAAAAIGEAAVPALEAKAREPEGLGLDRPPVPGTNDPNALRRRWIETSLCPDDAFWALAAMGSPALGALAGLASSGDAWLSIEAAWALGEIGPPARTDVTVSVLVALLDHPSHRVTRTATEAITAIGAVDCALDAFERILRDGNDRWRRPIVRTWTGEDQARVNVMLGLLQLAADPTRNRNLDSRIVGMIASVLDDRCGYLAGFGVEALSLLGTPEALRVGIDWLRWQRYDPSSTEQSPF